MLIYILRYITIIDNCQPIADTSTVNIEQKVGGNKKAYIASVPMEVNAG